MKKFRTRRGFVGLTTSLLASQALPLARADTPRTSSEGDDYYDKLGVTKIINAAGTYTVLTASTMPPSVQAAVDRAAKHPVRLLELQRSAGEYLAKRLHCEAAMVTAGASSALTLGTAACIGVMNNSPAQAVPMQVGNLKNEVVIQKAHRYSYDHALENCGVRFVEVESMHGLREGVHTTGLSWRISSMRPKEARSAAKTGSEWRTNTECHVSTTPRPTFRLSQIFGITRKWVLILSRSPAGKAFEDRRTPVCFWVERT